MTVAKTNEIIKEEMPRLVKLAVDKDREVSPVDISHMVSKEFAANVEKTDEIVMKKEVVDVSGSQEIRKEQKQTPIPLPIRSPNNFRGIDYYRFTYNCYNIQDFLHIKMQEKIFP
ncbi:hypothetical protein Tco_0253279, partial [Tanacetum coccineum]